MKIKLPFRISLLLTIGLLVSFQTVHANPITRQQALENANEFLQKRGINVKNVTMRQVPAFEASGTATENAPYFVFNIGDECAGRETRLGEVHQRAEPLQPDHA